MENPSSATASGRRARWLKWVAVVYLAAALAYVMYGLFTETGLVGYLMAISLELFGVVYFSIVLPIAGAVLVIPVFVVAVALARFAPHLVAESAKASTPAQPWPIVTSWKEVSAVISIILLGTAAIASWFIYSGSADLHEKVYALDLSDPNASLPKQAKFVELTGFTGREYLSGYRDGNYFFEVYAPVTGPRWNPAEPVSYFVHHETHTDYKGPPRLPSAFLATGAARFSGRMAGSLPSVMERELRSKGLQIAPSYLVIDWMELPDGKVPESQKYENAILTTIGGGGLAFFTFIAMAAHMVVKSRRTAR